MARYRTCPYCRRNDSPQSKEDVFAKWIAREFADERGRSWFTVESQMADLPRDRVFKTSCHFGLVTSKPCERCNNTWMSRLETAIQPIFRPLIRGESRAITSVQKLKLARWAVKTAMNYELMEDVTPRFFKPADYKDMRLSAAVPDQLVIYLGRYVGRHTLTADGGRGEMKLPLTSGAARQDCYLLTVTIGQLALQLFTFRWPKGYRGEISLRFPSLWPRCMIQFWPGLRDTPWPPDVALDDDGRDNLASRKFVPTLIDKG